MSKALENIEFYGQKRGKAIITKGDLDANYPEYCIQDKMVNLKEHSYLPSSFPENDPMAIMLKDKLLAVGGTRIIMPMVDEDLEKITERGQFWLGETAIMKRGRPSQCHANSANLYESNKNNGDINLKICTGYALSDDGIWRQHSWLVWAKARVNRIIETTVERVLYYGFVMDTDECEEFSSWY